MPVQPTVHPARCASGHSPAPSEARLLSALATLRDALAPDVALNLPAVLDEAALLACLSVLTNTTPTSAPATDPAPRPTLDRVAVTALLIDGMSNGERAVAIHAAGIPTKWRTLSVDQITNMALTGLARLGLPEIRAIDCYSRELALRSESAATRAELRRIWTSHRLHQAATDLAFHLRTHARRTTAEAVAA